MASTSRISDFILKSNLKHTPGWITLALVVHRGKIVAGKIVARKIVSSTLIPTVTILGKYKLCVKL